MLRLFLPVRLLAFMKLPRVESWAHNLLALILSLLLVAQPLSVHASQITQDTHAEIDFYLSTNTVKDAIKAGTAMTEIIGGLLERVREPALSAAIRNNEIDPHEALRQLRSGACGTQHGGLWEWIVPSAYASGCTLETISGKKIVIHDRATCIGALGKALYAGAIGTAFNADRLGKGLAKGVRGQGEELVALLSDPAGLAKAVGGMALEFYADPTAATARYGLAVADGLYEKSLLYVQALANGNYEAAGTAYTALKTTNKINALRKIEKVAAGGTTAIAGPAGSKIGVSKRAFISEARANHILYGDGTGGGHLWPGSSGKSPFPKNWSEIKILEEINSIAANPSIPGRVQANGRIVKEATVDGIKIRVVVEPPSKGGSVVTGFPTNIPRDKK